MRDLAIGMSGPDVRALQEGLNTRSEGIASPIAVDGVFGPETDQAVRAFQKRQQLDVDGVVGRETRPSIFHLALVTATIFGQKINSGQSLLNPPSLKDRVIAGFSPGKLQLGVPPAPEYAPRTLTIPDGMRKQMMDWATRPSGNVINIPDDVRRQMMNPKFYPIQFAQLSKPLAAPHIPEVTLPSSNSGAWKYDHCELQSGGQTVFPFTRSRQDSFVLTAQCISLRHLFPRSAVRARARPRDFLGMERESSHAAEKHSATHAMAEPEISQRSHAVGGNPRCRHCWVTRLSRHVLGSVSSAEDLAGSTQPREENWHRPALPPVCP